MTAKKKPVPQQPILDQDIPLSTDVVTMCDVQGTGALLPDFVSNGGMVGLAKALAAAQAECQNVTLNKTNPHFRSRYADLAAVRDAVIPIFAKHGLAVVQAPNVVPDVGFVLETRIIHAGGQSLSFYWPLPMNIDKPQSIASAVTYARRISMASVAAIAGEEDDDGNAAQNSHGGGLPAGGGGSRGGAAAGGYTPGGNGPAGGIVL